jgi:hypothetical protein
MVSEALGSRPEIFRSQPFSEMREDFYETPPAKDFEPRVVVTGNTASFYADKKKLADFTGIAPESGALVGFDFTTFKAAKTPVSLVLKSFEVHEVK